ncbi:MAG: hypothetical protein AB7L94_27110 [Kofleriaceae bacterium]
MHIQWRWLVVPSLLIAASGCPDVKVDNDEIGSGGPVVEFDPGNRIIPFPNNLLLDPMTGKVNVPASCGEGAASMATRVGVVNKLDGFGTYETVMTATFSDDFDPASFMDGPASRVVLYKRASGGAAVDPAMANPVPVVFVPSMTARFDADCVMTGVVPQMIMVAARPLEQKSTYTAAILKGIKADSGAEFGPSFTWSLVRQAESPVTLDAQGNVTANNTPLDPTNDEDLATLQGLDLLWKAHAQALAFLESKTHAREDILLAWDFNTQTTTDPLDPAVTDSPAAMVSNALPLQVGSLTANLDRANPPYVLCDAAGGGPGTDNNVQCFLKIALGSAACTQPACPTSQIYATGNATCASVGCAAVGDVLGGAFNSRQYMAETPNAFDANKPIPGPWSDPLKPDFVKNEIISFIAIVPASPAPTDGYPVVVFGHGLGSSKTTVFAIGPQLSAPQAALSFASGFITVAIDFVAHDSRAVRISDDAALGCDGTRSATSSPQCFAPFLSTNLGTTRDGIRQSVLDLHGLVETLKACGNTTCATNFATLGAGNFHIDPTHINYLGISLGGIIGSTAVASKPDFKSAVLNVPGVGWVDILEKTSTLAIKCPLVNGLIDAGILMGEKSNATLTTGLCTTDDWQLQAGYRQFATIGRWVLDPADPANFTQKLAPKRFMIQKVEGDAVVPNYATDAEAALTGVAANGFNGACAPQAGTFGPTPSVAVPGSNKFATYVPLMATATCPDATGTNQASAGTVFSHSSLLRPVPGTCSTAGHTCTSTTQAVGDAQCTAQNGGTASTCDIASVARGQLGTRRMQTDAITFLILNR